MTFSTIPSTNGGGSTNGAGSYTNGAGSSTNGASSSISDFNISHFVHSVIMENNVGIILYRDGTSHRFTSILEITGHDTGRVLKDYMDGDQRISTTTSYVNVPGEYRVTDAVRARLLAEIR
jgi:hypothetical protein